jgi:redox-sensitive bicupin YhaK (pirin superfamily)
VTSSSIELLVESRERDLGGFTVRRVLPSVRRRLVGPFVFFDHMGPLSLPPGSGLDVRPHPHIGLATVTYLFEGEIDHRDSLGTFQTIRPGDVNWMLAGQGIVHSERSGAEARRGGARAHGIQSWVALPLEHELAEPRFQHCAGTSIPRVTREGATLEVVAGTAYGAESPVSVLSPTLYVHAELREGARLDIDDGHEERAIYIVEGRARCEGEALLPGTMAVLVPGAGAVLEADARSRVMIVGGAKLEGERHVYWNFVSSSLERIESASAEWAGGRFPKVPGDEVEFIPLPEGTRPPR